jgi:glycosyltransferase involved in cell wall biosynthesis
MRILYFSRDYTTHDHRFLSALAELCSLQPADHQVYYLRLEQGSHILETRPIPEPIQPVAWVGGRGRVGWKDIPRFWVDLRRVIQTIQPDLIQAGPIQRSAFLVALTGFQPLISMSWGYDLLFDAYRSAAWRWATRYTLQHSTVMIGDSEVVRQKAIAHGMASDRIITFPWGVDLQYFNQRSAPLLNEDAKGDTGVSNQRASKLATPIFTLLSTRSWEPIYGVDVIAHAFVIAAQKLRAQIPGRARQRNDLRLMMLGNGSQAGLLRQIFKEGNVADRVSFPGQVDQVDLPRYYQSADLYLSASHSDGASISLLEALACGCPAIVADIPGNREWISPGVQGWLFPDGDAEALAQSILNAVEACSRLPEMGHAARRLAEERANWKQNSRHIFTAYQLAGYKSALSSQ